MTPTLQEAEDGDTMVALSRAMKFEIGAKNWHPDARAVESSNTGEVTTIVVLMAPEGKMTLPPAVMGVLSDFNVEVQSRERLRWSDPSRAEWRLFVPEPVRSAYREAVNEHDRRPPVAHLWDPGDVDAFHRKAVLDGE